MSPPGSSPPLPELVRGPPVDHGGRRRRALWIAAGIGGALLLSLIGWGLWPRGDRSRPVILVAPAGSRLSVDGQPVPTLGSEGNHLLRLEPGGHELELHLRGDQVVVHHLEVVEGTGALQLEARYDRTWGRWQVVQPDADKPDGDQPAQPAPQ